MNLTKISLFLLIQCMFVCSRNLKQESAAKSPKNKEKSVLEEKKNQRWDVWEREKGDEDEIKKRMNLDSECKHHKVRFEKPLSESSISLTALIFAVAAISIFILLQIGKLLSRFLINSLFEVPEICIYSCIDFWLMIGW